MDRFGTERARPVDRHQSGSPNGWHVETVGAVFARPVPPRSARSLRFSGEAAELAELKKFPRTPQTNNEATVWEAAVGGLRAHQFWNDQLSRKTLEYRLD